MMNLLGHALAGILIIVIVGVPLGWALSKLLIREPPSFREIFKWKKDEHPYIPQFSVGATTFSVFSLVILSTSSIDPVLSIYKPVPADTNQPVILRDPPLITDTTSNLGWLTA